MKKFLIISCIVLSLLGILISAAPFILKITGLDSSAKRILLENILTDSGHQFDLQKIDIRLGKFEISEVSFKSSDNRLEVFIEEIILEFSIIDYLKSPASFKKSLREIYFTRPKLIIHEKSTIKKELVSAEIQNLKSFITELNLYQNLGIADGQIIYQDRNDLQHVVAQYLNGWLIHNEDEKISLNVIGSSLSSDTENFKLEAQINDNSQDFISNIAILDYNCDDPSLELLFESIAVDGLANGSLAVEGNFGKLDSLVVNGTVIISDMQIEFEEEHFSDINIVLNISNNSISVDEGVFKYQGNPVTINAFIPQFYERRITGNINSFNFPVAALKKIMPVTIFNGSAINYSLDFDIDPEDYLVLGSIKSDNFSLYDAQFKKFETSLNISNKGIRLTDLKASRDNMLLSGSADYNSFAHNWGIKLKGNYTSGQHVLFDNLSNANHSFNAGLNFNSKSKVSSGKWNYIISGIDSVFSSSGNLKGDSLAITIGSNNSNFNSFNSQVKIFDYLDNPFIDRLSITNFPFHVFSSNSIFENLYDWFDTRVLLSGTLNNLKGNLQLNDKTSNKQLANLSAQVIDVAKENKKISGKVEIKSLKGSFGANINSTLLASHFYFDEGLKGEFIVDLSKEDEEVNGDIAIENLKILKIFADDAEENDYRFQGEISGDIDIFGSFKNPQMSGAITGNRFVLNEIGYFQPNFSFSLDKNIASIDTITISHNNRPVLTGNFDWSLLTNKINGILKGDSLDLETYLTTFDVNEGIISGTADYEAHLTGTAEKLQIETRFNVLDGELDNIKYDMLEVDFQDNIVNTGGIFNFENHLIYLHSFNMARQGHFHLNSTGLIPLSTNDRIDYSLNFDGDIFNLIPQWEPFFKDGASLADITLKFNGTRDNPKLSAADISINRGELWLASVAEHIENISGEIRLKEGSNKIDINLIAHVGDDYLKINTVRNILTAGGRKLDDWLFKGVDLDFGVLALQTNAEGINVNIPGLMNAAETGQIHLTGKENNRPFYFAGPVKRPFAYGLVTLNNASVTYPFIKKENSGGKRSTAVEFLSNMEWDATLKSGEDVLYAREIPAYFDNVLAEVTIDEKSQGINFTGVIDNGTFKPVGSLVSSRGRLEYLDLNFKVDRFTVDFFQNKDLPDVSGKAWTSIRDSVGAVPKTIYLQLYAIDKETGQIKQFGNWDDFKFKLVSADPTIGETQEQVLAYLGYSVENIKEKATNVGGALTDKYLIRPFLRPVEKILERSLGVDLVRFNSKIAKNLFYSSIVKNEQTQKANPFSNPFSNEIPYLYLMSSSEVTVGKYLNENIYLTYTGQLVSVYDELETGYDINHSLGVEYRFYKNILLEFEWDRELMKLYDYANQRQYLDDFKIRFRHSFSF